jgi:hypothetical protein
MQPYRSDSHCGSLFLFLYNPNYLQIYDCLQLSAQKKESGELSILLQIGLPVNILKQMEIYAYHLSHPNLSQFQVALHFNTDKKTIWNSYQFLNQLIV